MRHICLIYLFFPNFIIIIFVGDPENMRRVHT